MPDAALPLAILVVSTAVLAGCVQVDPSLPAQSYRAMGFDGTTWPSLDGTTVTVLAYASYAAAFAEHKKAFENLTRAKVTLVTSPDSGKVLERALAEKGDPTFDVVYGIDNVLLGRAVREGAFQRYEPVLGSRIAAEHRLAPAWEATPVDHGYIGVNVDPRPALAVATLDDVRAHAGEFVTEDPRTSTPGLGFLIATVATYGERSDARYDYVDYWNDLFAGGALVVADWDQAYVDRFSGGYGQFETGTRHDRAIVTSYTTSPAYEMFYGYDQKNGLVLAPNATFHQIQTVAVAAGAKNPAGAQAWIEFCLTDAFQGTVAGLEAIYPVVASANATAETAKVFGGNDPPPGSFAPAPFPYDELDRNVARWIREWTDAYERASA